MNTNINLLPQRQVSQRKSRKFFFFSAGLFSVIVLASFALFAYNLFLKNSIANLEEEILTTKTSAAAQSAQKVRALTLKERLTHISKILTTRSDLNVKLNAVTESVPQDLEINALQTSETSISLAISSQDLAKINEYLENDILTYARDKFNRVSRVDMGSMNFNPESQRYSLTISIIFEG